MDAETRIKLTIGELSVALAIAQARIDALEEAAKPNADEGKTMMPAKPRVVES